MDGFHDLMFHNTDIENGDFHFYATKDIEHATSGNGLEVIFQKAILKAIEWEIRS